MKIAQLVLPLLFTTVLAGEPKTAAQETNSKTKSLVKLLEGLKDTITKEGTAGQTSYDKFACTCEEETEDNKGIIKESKQTIKATSEEILKLEALSKAKAALMKELEDDIARVKGEIKDAKATRNGEHKEYQKFQVEKRSAYEALFKAVEVLENAAPEDEFAEKKKDGDTTSKTYLLTVSTSLQFVLNQHDITDKFPAEDIAAVRSFLNPSALQTGHNPFGNYKSQTGVIVGTLKQMLDEVSRDIQLSLKDEADQNEAFTKFLKDKKAEQKEYEKALEEATKAYNKAVKELAENRETRADAEDALEKAEKYLEALTQACRDGATAWSGRTHCRTSELTGITAAVTILENMKKNPEKSKDEKKPYKFLQLVAKKSPFTQVIADIKKFIAELKQEHLDDTAHRDRCEMAEHKTKADTAEEKEKSAELKDDKKRAKEEKDAAEADQKSAVKEVKEAEKAKADLKKARMAEKDDFRKRQHLSILQEKSLIKAKATFEAGREFEEPTQLIQEDPEEDEKKKTKPDEFTHTECGNKDSEATGLSAIMEMLIEDVRNERDAEQTAETEAQNNYNKLVADLDAKILSLNKEKLAAEEKAQGLSEDINKMDEGLKASKEEQDRQKSDGKLLDKDCSWADDFAEREKKRNLMIRNLNIAIQQLQGADMKPN